MTFPQRDISTTNYFFQHDILSTWHFIKCTYCLLAISSTWCLSNLMFRQSDVLRTWCFINLTMCKLAVSSPCHFINLPLCQRTISSTHYFITALKEDEQTLLSLTYTIRVTSPCIKPYFIILSPLLRGSLSNTLNHTYIFPAHWQNAKLMKWPCTAITFFLFRKLSWGKCIRASRTLMFHL